MRKEQSVIGVDVERSYTRAVWIKRVGNGSGWR